MLSIGTISYRADNSSLASSFISDVILNISKRMIPYQNKHFTFGYHQACWVNEYPFAQQGGLENITIIL